MPCIIESLWQYLLFIAKAKTDFNYPFTTFQKRYVLEENNELEPRVSLLEAEDLDFEDDDEDDDDEEFEEKKKLVEMLDKAKEAPRDGKSKFD